MKNVKKLTARFLFFLLLAIYLPFHAAAWGVTGHRIVGEIASFHLSSRARKEIQKILGNESLAMAANWGDFIKSDSTYNYLYNWHFVNVDKQYNFDQLSQLLKTDTSVNVYTKINMIVDSLKDKNLEASKKLMYLRLLIHFVGDVHQPLHVGHSTDEGGGKLKLLWFGAPTNLHTMWDSKLVDFQQLSYTEYAAYLNHSTSEERTAWQKTPLAGWVYESYEYAGKIYSEYKGEDQKLSYNYNFEHIGTLNKQLLKGGVRLAGLLNEIFR